MRCRAWTPRVSHGHASSGPHDAGVSDRRARRATDRLPGRGRALLGAARRAHPLGEEAVLPAESASRVGGARGVHPRRGRHRGVPRGLPGGRPRGPPRPRPARRGPALAGARRGRGVGSLRDQPPGARAVRRRHAALRAREPLPRVESVMDAEVRITDLRVYGASRDVALAVSLDQPASGTVYLTGRPAYRAGRLALDASISRRRAGEPCCGRRAVSCTPRSGTVLPRS